MAPDTLQEGIQILFPQPDLSCQDDILVLSPPLSIHYLSAHTNLYSKEAQRLLDHFVACYHKQNPRPEVLIKGHMSEIVRTTDDTSAIIDKVDELTPDYAKDVSLRNATNLSSYLASKGIPPEKIT